MNCWKVANMRRLVGGRWRWFAGRQTSAKNSFHCQHKSSSYHRITRPRISQLLTFFIVHHRRDVNTLHMPWINLLFIKQFPTTSSRRRQRPSWHWPRSSMDRMGKILGASWTAMLSRSHRRLGLTERCSMPIPEIFREKGDIEPAYAKLSAPNELLWFFFPPGLNGWVGRRYLSSAPMISSYKAATWFGWRALRKQMLSHSDQIDRFVSIRVPCV